MKKIIGLFTGIALLTAVLAGCGAGTATASPAGSASPAAMTGDITVISREEGSGTRGAFIELFGIEEKDADGNKIDYTTDTADISNSTQVVITSVAQNTQAIGYISLGALNDTVKALDIDGVSATVEHIEDGSYTVSRPFNIATKGTVSEAAQDFIDYILSADGQAVVEAAGYIAVSDAPAYSGSAPAGKIVVAGSSSVTPVMEKLREAYLLINPNATIEVQQSDSTSGMTGAIDGVCDIGMASRELKDSETEAGLTATVIAMDGIAVVVNPENPIDNMTKTQVKDIYTGAVTDWSDLS